MNICEGTCDRACVKMVVLFQDLRKAEVDRGGRPSVAVGQVLACSSVKEPFQMSAKVSFLKTRVASYYKSIRSYYEVDLRSAYC